MNPSKPPLSRIIKEGTIGNCPKCHSTTIRIPWIFGKKYCINIDCIHYAHSIGKKPAYNHDRMMEQIFKDQKYHYEC